MHYIDGKGKNTLTGVTNTTVVGLFRKEDKKGLTLHFSKMLYYCNAYNISG
jgi:hypothetical protein